MVIFHFTLYFKLTFFIQDIMQKMKKKKRIFFEIFKIIKFICQVFCDEKKDGRVEGEDE